MVCWFPRFNSIQNPMGLFHAMLSWISSSPTPFFISSGCDSQEFHGSWWQLDSHSCHHPGCSPHDFLMFLWSLLFSKAWAGPQIRIARPCVPWMRPTWAVLASLNNGCCRHIPRAHSFPMTTHTWPCPKIRLIPALLSFSKAFFELWWTFGVGQGGPGNVHILGAHDTHPKWISFIILAFVVATTPLSSAVYICKARNGSPIHQGWFFALHLTDRATQDVLHESASWNVQVFTRPSQVYVCIVVPWYKRNACFTSKIRADCSLFIYIFRWEPPCFKTEEVLQISVK